MKKRLKHTAFIAVLCIGSFSCDTDFLNTQPLDKIPSAATWSDAALSEAFVNNIYSYLGNAGFEEQGLASYTDEAMFTHSGRNIDIFNEGSENPSNVAWASATYAWNNMYLAIRQANVALENLSSATFDNLALKNRLMGETYFMRAYFYHQLLRFYGGVPLVDKSYGLNEDYSIARSSYEACTNFIMTDLDKAIELLNSAATVPGRASKLAAMSLKTRVLLYAASDLHDVTKAKANSTVLAAYPNIELVAYTTGNQYDRYMKAKIAAKALLDATTGYKLDFNAPVSIEEGKKNYKAIAMGGQSAVFDVEANNELIFQRTETPLYNSLLLGGLHYGLHNGPNGYHNWAGNTPIQQLVDDYEMMDGSKFDWTKTEHSKAPYEKRDPRFYATILYDGSKWKPRPPDVALLDPMNEIQTGFYDNGKGGVINGIDTRKSSIEDWNGSRTNYYTHKFIDFNPALVDNQSDSQIIPWPFIRYTEMVLSYAEAAFKTGEEDIAREWINKIRFRAGMPAITDVGDDLWKRIMNERRIELAYEEHRYHDARRWMIASETLGRGIKAINIQAKLKPGITPHSPYRYDTAVYDYVYSVYDETSNEKRTWKDKMYYRVISRDEVNRNPKLVQNPGYE